jgi:hypothetical protein
VVVIVLAWATRECLLITPFDPSLLGSWRRFDESGGPPSFARSLMV